VDSQAWAGRLADDLREYYGKARVYRDIDSNRPAADFTRLIDQALTESRMVIVLIGPEWLAGTGPGGSRRLDAPDDLVRLEIERALSCGIAVVPVFVGGATMPRELELPESIRALARIQGERLSDEDWRYNFGRLVETLEKHGVRPASQAADDGEDETLTATVRRTVTGVLRYERTLQATRRRAYDAVVGAVELLCYPIVEDDPEGAQVRFTALMRTVTGRVVDSDGGRSTVVLEFTSVSWKGIGGGFLASAVAPLAWAAAAGGVGLRAMDRRFASGFLDNVERVLEGRGIGEDSARFPGMEKWLARRRKL
jgi:hypothetical protein